MPRNSPFLLETVVWFGFCFLPFHSITFFWITVSRIGIFLKVTYSNVSLCRWQKWGKQSAETFLGDGSPGGKVARMTLRCRSSKLEPLRSLVFSKGWLTSVSRTPSIWYKVLDTNIWYSFLPLVWNQDFALVLFAVSEMDWNNALCLWG